MIPFRHHAFWKPLNPRCPRATAWLPAALITLLFSASALADDPPAEAIAAPEAAGQAARAADQAAAETPPAPPPTPSPAPASAEAAAHAEPPPKQGGKKPKPERSTAVDEITITATRDARPTKRVPQAIAVIGKERIAETNMFNVKEVISGTPGVLIESKNGGYDARLIIRGAGLKAAYGVREIMVLRDGVPLTDPDSFTRFDWIDTQDIERIEIAKGPGNIYSPGSAGGAIQIISRSVFDPGADVARAGYGNFDTGNLHLRTSAQLEGQAIAVSASYRGTHNNWRARNHFQTRQVGLKHGILLGGGKLESELAYTESDTQLPGGMNQDLWDTFVKTGRQNSTSEVWKHSGRYSKIVFLNTRFERDLGDLTFKPRLYFNQWKHTHPVTGLINAMGDWTRSIGTDLEATHRHRMGGISGTLVFGATARAQWNNDVRQYLYREISASSGRITATLSDAQGDLANTQRQLSFLAGAFAQESLRFFGDRVTLDVGARLDANRFRIQENEITKYDYSQGKYAAGGGEAKTDRTFGLPAPKVGLSVAVLPEISAYVSAAMASQVPSEGEISANGNLKASRSRSAELGIKGRASAFSFDAAIYTTAVDNEIVAVLTPGGTAYDNAGRTDKKGLEASLVLRPGLGFEVGLDYGYSDYRYGRYSEEVGDTTVSRDGNRLQFIPVHQYAASLAWRNESFRARAQTRTWGEYWMDPANTEKYKGYKLITSLGAGWTLGKSELSVQAENLFDQRYAVQVSKDTRGKVVYTAGSPRTVLFSYSYRL
jgi:iron complex outermembrane receptor protein